MLAIVAWVSVAVAFTCARWIVADEARYPQSMTIITTLNIFNPANATFASRAGSCRSDQGGYAVHCGVSDRHVRVDGAVCGYSTSYPMNRWLIRAGLKEAMCMIPVHRLNSFYELRTRIAPTLK